LQRCGHVCLRRQPPEGLRRRQPCE
jgi:hypothetical protein